MILCFETKVPHDGRSHILRKPYVNVLVDDANYVVWERVISVSVWYDENS